MVSDTATEQGDRPPEQSEVPHTPGETGLWVFLLGDMVVFVVMFVAFLSERAVDADLFTSSRESVSLVIALTNTMVLLVSSLAVVIALNAVRAGRFSPAVRAFGVALCARSRSSGSRPPNTRIWCPTGTAPTATPISCGCSSSPGCIWRMWYSVLEC